MNFNGEPTAGRLGDFCTFHAQKAGNGGACEIDIEDTNRMPGETEREGELGCYGGFADAAFAGEDLRREWVLARVEAGE